MTTVEPVVNRVREEPLPNGWQRIRLGAVCDRISNGTSATQNTEKKGVPVSRIETISTGNINTEKVGWIEASREDLQRYLLRSGDILFSHINSVERLGNCAIYDGTPSVLIHGINLLRFEIKKEVADPFYVLAYLKSEDARRFYNERARRAIGQASLNTKDLGELEIPVPPLSEQRRIAAILNEQMAAVERARAAAEAQLKAAKALAAAYLRAVFNSLEAQRWLRQRFGDVCELLPAKSLATDGDTSVLAITTACLSETGFQPSGIKPARMWASDAAECVVSRGEVLIARSNTPELVGRVAMFSGNPKGAVASDLTIRIRPRDDLEPPFLTAYLSFLYLSGYWKDRAGGASGSMKKITRTQILNEKVPVPPLPEQKRISTHLSAQMDLVERNSKALETQLATINKLPAALLRRAFTGEL